MLLDNPTKLCNLLLPYMYIVSMFLGNPIKLLILLLQIVKYCNES